MEAWTTEEDQILIENKIRGLMDASISAKKLQSKTEDEIKEHWIELQQERPELVGLDRFTYLENQRINYLNTKGYLNRTNPSRYGPEDIAKELGATVDEVLERAEILHRIGFRKPGCNHDFSKIPNAICWNCRDDLFRTCPWILRHNVIDGMKIAEGLKPGDHGYAIACPRYKE